MKQAIVVTSFGVSDQSVKKKCIDSVIEDVRREFPNFAVFEAWTCHFLIKKLAKEGIKYGTLEAVLDNLAEAGYEKVVILPTHLTPGEEFTNKILQPVEEAKGKFAQLKVAYPVLTGDKPGDYAGKAELLADLSALEAGEELVLMGHGSPHKHNPVYELIQQYADDTNMPVHIGVVEEDDHPNLKDVIRRLQDRGVKKVFMRPMMLVGGDHANNDMAEDEPDSWKNQLQSAGIQVRCSTSGLGENDKYRSLYIEKLQEVI